MICVLSGGTGGAKFVDGLRRGLGGVVVLRTACADTAEREDGQCDDWNVVPFAYRCGATAKTYKKEFHVFSAEEMKMHNACDRARWLAVSVGEPQRCHADGDVGVHPGASPGLTANLHVDRQPPSPNLYVTPM